MLALGAVSGTDLGALLGKSGSAGAAARGEHAAARGGNEGTDRADPSGGARLSVRERVRTMQVEMLFAATIRVSGGLSLAAASAPGSDVSDAPDLASQLAEIMAAHSEAFAPDGEGVRPIDRLREMFTPEKTAERIFSFAVSWYGQWLDGRADTEEARAEFAEYIGGAVQQGFDEASAVLGVLPDPVQGEIDRTHELVFGAFEDFVAGGLGKSLDELAAARASGLAFNATFGGFSDPVALMDQVLGRLNPDGTLQLASTGVPGGSGQLLDMVA